MTKSHNSDKRYNFIIRNKDKILYDENYNRLFKILYVLSHCTSTTESNYFKAFLHKVISLIVKFLDETLPSNCISKDIDLCLFLPLFDDVIYLQACYQKVQIKFHSFDKFITAYQQNIYFENEITKNQIIEYLFTMFNADYEINKLLNYYQMSDASTITIKNNHPFVVTKVNKSTLYKTLSRNSFYNSNSYSEMMESILLMSLINCIY